MIAGTMLAAAAILCAQNSRIQNQRWHVFYVRKDTLEGAPIFRPHLALDVPLGYLPIDPSENSISEASRVPTAVETQALLDLHTYLRPFAAPQDPAHSCFLVKDWPFESLDSVGFAYVFDNEPATWMRVGDTRIFLCQPSPEPRDSRIHPMKQYGLHCAEQLLRLPASWRKANVLIFQFSDDDWIGSISFPGKRRSGDLKHFDFLTNGSLIAFAFGSDQDLVLPHN